MSHLNRSSMKFPKPYRCSLRPLLMVFSCVLFCFLGSALQALWAAEKPTVNALLFYKSDCKECTEIISALLPKWQDQHGDQLKILAVNTASSEGGTLYLDAVLKINIPFSTRLPIVIIGNQYLGGAKEITKKLPTIIEEKLGQNGTKWPTLEGLPRLIANTPQSSGDTISFWVSDFRSNRLGRIKENTLNKLRSDPLGNSASLIVLILMIGSIISKPFMFRKNNQLKIITEYGWGVPVLSFVGMGTSLYLTYVKFSLSEAFCGPIGDCNAVQQSQFASLFGFLPVSLAGLMVFFLIALLWFLQKIYPKKFNIFGSFIGLIVLASVFFFIYLTFLEPFVIGATCIWCLLSALTMTALYWLTSIQPSPPRVDKL
jgi:uncharacterized membrane protein